MYSLNLEVKGLTLLLWLFSCLAERHFCSVKPVILTLSLLRVINVKIPLYGSHLWSFNFLVFYFVQNITGRVRRLWPCCRVRLLTIQNKHCLQILRPLSGGLKCQLSPGWGARRPLTFQATCQENLYSWSYPYHCATKSNCIVFRCCIHKLSDVCEPKSLWFPPGCPTLQDEKTKAVRQPQCQYFYLPRWIEWLRARTT